MEEDRKRERAAANESFSVDASHVIVLLDTLSSRGFTDLILTNTFSLFTYSFICISRFCQLNLSLFRAASNDYLHD